MKLTFLHADVPEHQALSAAIKTCNAMEKQTDMQPIRDLLEKIPASREINQWLNDNPAFTAEVETQALITKQAKKLEAALSTLGEKTMAMLGIKLKPIEKDNKNPNTTLLLELVSMMDDKHRTAFLDKSNLGITPKELNNFDAMDYKKMLMHLTKTGRKSAKASDDAKTKEETLKTIRTPSDTHEARPETDDTHDMDDKKTGPTSHH
jgi:hypothetical protein